MPYKKIFLFLSISIITIQTSFAYTPSNILAAKLVTTTEKIDLIIEKNGDSYREKIQNQLIDFEAQYTWNDAIVYVLNYLIQHLSQAQENCTIYDDFSISGKNNWRIINDGVMGGLSKWNIVNEDDSLIFSGNINTNGGWFTSIRSPLSTNILSSTDYIKLRFKSDTRSYKLTFRDSYSTWVSYQADILSQTPWVSEDINIPLSQLKANYFGRSINTRAFNKSQAQEIWFIISDGINWAFQLEIEKIEFCEE